MANHSSTVAASSAVRDRERGGVSSVWRALRHRNFQLFFGGQLISLTGTWMQSVAQSWLVYRLTGSAILVASIGEGWCFLLNGASYLAVIAGLLMMKVGAPSRIPREASAIADIVEGFRFVGRSAPVRALMLLLGLVSLTGMPYAVLMPVFADRILHSGASGLGILMGASGFGAFLGAFSLAVRRGWRGLGTWVAYSSVGFGLSLIAFSYSRWFWLSALLLLPIGFSMMVGMASSNTLLQVMVPDHLRGRVMAVYSMMFMGMAPFGALLAGGLAGRWG